jgi:hypothetical protein
MFYELNTPVAEGKLIKPVMDAALKVLFNNAGPLSDEYLDAEWYGETLDVWVRDNASWQQWWPGQDHNYILERATRQLLMAGIPTYKKDRLHIISLFPSTFSASAQKMREDVEHLDKLYQRLLSLKPRDWVGYSIAIKMRGPRKKGVGNALSNLG